MIVTTVSVALRVAIVLLLIGWLLITPILLAATGLTLSDPADASRLGAIFIGQAIACCFMLVALTLWSRKRLLWVAAGVLGTWSIIAIELKSLL